MFIYSTQIISFVEEITNLMHSTSLSKNTDKKNFKNLFLRLDLMFGLTAVRQVRRTPREISLAAGSTIKWTPSIKIYDKDNLVTEHFRQPLPYHTQACLQTRVAQEILNIYDNSCVAQLQVTKTAYAFLTRGIPDACWRPSNRF